MLNRMCLPKKLLRWEFALLILVVSCGAEDKKDDEGENGSGTGSGWVTKATSESTDITFADAEAGAQYVIMPYSLGDPKTVLGADDTTVTFKLAISTGGGSGLRQLRQPMGLGPQYFAHQSFPEAMSWREYDRSIRILLRHFDASKGMDQGKWFWHLAEKVDAVAELIHYQGNRLTGFVEEKAIPFGGVRDFFQDVVVQADSSANEKYAALTTTAAECPEDDVIIPDKLEPLDETDTIEVDSSDIVNGSDYCIVYASDPVSESDKSAIEQSVSTIIKRFKDVIYKDKFADVNEFSFKPIIAVVDFKDQTKWTAKTVLHKTGFVLNHVNEEAGMPVVYMAADLDKVTPSSLDADTAKKLWHGALAHEISHTIVDYYRNRKPAGGGAEETVAIDEALAHFYEDIFGYGDENYPNYQKTFLDVFAFGSNPFLDNGEDAGGATSRGAAQILIYYLASQKGGFKFTDGVISGGAGLDFLTAVGKSATTQGPNTLSDVFGGDWVETVGNYLGALALDGTNVEGIEDKYKTQEPQTGVHDLNGSTDKTFGFDLNGFLGVADHMDEYTKAKEQTDELSLKFYMTQPILYTVEDPDAKVTVTSNQTTNTAVSVVRLK